MNDIIELNFEAEDISDEGWQQIFDILKKNLNGFTTLYGNGNNVTITYHAHKYEVWSSCYDNGNLKQEDLLCSTDDLLEAQAVARRDKNITDKETTGRKTFTTEIRTDFNDSLGSYCTIEIKYVD